MFPAAVSFPASPAVAFTPRISAPVPAGTMPALRVPAMLVSAENKLHLIDQVKAIDGRVHASRYDCGVRGASQATDRECDDECDFQTAHGYALPRDTGARFELAEDARKHCPCRPTPRRGGVLPGRRQAAPTLRRFRYPASMARPAERSISSIDRTCGQTRRHRLDGLCVGKAVNPRVLPAVGISRRGRGRRGRAKRHERC